MDNKNNETKKDVITRSISFDSETLGYLDKISERDERNRSAMVRILIKDHMKANSRNMAAH